MGTLKVGTLNVNGLTSTARTEMLNASLRIHNFDVLLLQEVVHPFSTAFYGYDVHYKIGTSRRGTAIVTRDTIQLTNISKIPSGRAIAAD
jgi:exonuclease III